MAVHLSLTTYHRFFKFERCCRSNCRDDFCFSQISIVFDRQNGTFRHLKSCLEWHRLTVWRRDNSLCLAFCLLRGPWLQLSWFRLHPVQTWPQFQDATWGENVSCSSNFPSDLLSSASRSWRMWTRTLTIVHCCVRLWIYGMVWLYFLEWWVPINRQPLLYPSLINWHQQEGCLWLLLLRKLEWPHQLQQLHRDWYHVLVVYRKSPQRFWTLGMRVIPPTSRTASKSSAFNPASLRQFSQGIANLSINHRPCLPTHRSK